VHGDAPGRLLVKHGIAGKIYSSEATDHLCKIPLPDSSQPREITNADRFPRPPRHGQEERMIEVTSASTRMEWSPLDGESVNRQSSQPPTVPSLTLSQPMNGQRVARPPADARLAIAAWHKSYGWTAVPKPIE
jgi:hypothetical protein